MWKLEGTQHTAEAKLLAVHRLKEARAQYKLEYGYKSALHDVADTWCVTRRTVLRWVAKVRDGENFRVLATLKMPTPRIRGVCKCGRPHHARGMCLRHYLSDRRKRMKYERQVG